MVVASETMRRLLLLSSRVARGNASVLISGQSGTGKELIARIIHLRSMRKDHPFIDVNCAALPEHLVESELFGYEKGAFSGADQSKPGFFELADKGTLFLDEIGELDPKVQAKLLRVLDGMPYYRLGGKTKISPNVRIVAASNRDLEDTGKENTFREDLFHRLGQFQLRVPSLADRPEDILPIAEFFLSQIQPGLSMSEPVSCALLRYGWPGNVRELRNVINHAATITDSDVIELSHLPDKLQVSRPMKIAAQGGLQATTLDDLERQTIVTALAESGGHQGFAAERLGISRRTLSRRLQNYKGALGVIAVEQLPKYRVTVSVPVTVKTPQDTMQFTTANISELGLALTESCFEPGEQCEAVGLSFTLPGSGEISCMGRLVWSSNGKAGFEFHQLSQSTKKTLLEFLKRKIKEEGWTTSAEL